MRRGFTLVELLVVIGIMGILMLISVPLFQRFYRGQGLKEAGRVIQQVFRRARGEALAKRERVRVVFTSRALGIYRQGTGYGDDFEPIKLPKGVTYVYNFGEVPGLSPPDTFPPEDQITRGKTGDDFMGVVEYRMDGSLNFGGGFQDLPQPEVNEIRLFDPNRVITRRVPRDVVTDLVMERRGDTKRCYVDIMPNTGRVVFVVLEAEYKRAEK